MMRNEENPTNARMNIKSRFQSKAKYLAYKQTHLYNDEGNIISLPNDDIIINKEKKVIMPFIPLDKSDYIPMDQKHLETILERRQRKNHNRIGFKSRAKGPLAFRNPNRYIHMTMEERLYNYNKSHKCKCHKLRFNRIIRTNVDNKPWYTFHCDRGIFPETNPQTTKLKCGRCFQGSIQRFNRDCACHVYRCLYCKFTEYHPYGETSLASEMCSCNVTRKSLLNEKIEARLAEVKPTTSSWAATISQNKDLEILPSVDTIKDVPSNTAPILPNRRNIKGYWKLKKSQKKLATQTVENIEKLLEPMEVLSIHGQTISMDLIQIPLEVMKKTVRASIATVKLFVLKMKDMFRTVCQRIATNLTLNGLANKIMDYFSRAMEFFMSMFESFEEAIPYQFMPIIFESVKDFYYNPTIRRLLNFLPILYGWYAEHNNLSARLRKQNLELGIDWMIVVNLLVLLVQLKKKKKAQEEQKLREFEATMHGFNADFSWKTRELGTALLNLLNRISGFAGKHSESMLRYLRNFNTISGAWKNVSSVCAGLLEFMPEFLAKYFKSTDPRTVVKKLLKDPKSPLNLMSHIACEIAVKRSAGKEVPSDKQAYYDARTQFYMDLSKNQVPLMPEIHRFVAGTDKLVSSPVMANPEFREPFVIRLTGGAGTGKSTLAPVLLQAISGETLEKTKSLVYTRDPNSEYWDGFTRNHKYVMYDDFNQSREEQDLAEVILLASCGVLLGNFSNNDPALQDTHGTKGDAINIDALVLCSNVGEIHANTLNSNEAINRRRHVAYEFAWNDEIAAMNSTFHRQEQDWSHLVVYKLDEKYKRIPGSNYEGKEAIKFMRADVLYNYKKFREVQASVADILEDLCTEVDLSKVYVQGSTAMTPKYRRTNEPILDPNAKTIQVVQRLDADTGTPLVSVIDSQEYVDAVLNRPYKWKTGKKIYEAAKKGLLEPFFKGFSFFRDFVYSWKSLLIPLVTLTTAAILYFWPERTPELHSGENKSQKMKVTVRAKHSQVVKEQHAEEITQFLLGNVTGLMVGTNYTNAIFIKERVVMAPRHLFYDAKKKVVDDELPLIDDGTPMVLLVPGMENTRDVFSKENLVSVLPDVVLYRFNSHVIGRRTILQHFWEGREVLNARPVLTYQVKSKDKRVATSFGRITKDALEAVAHVDGYTMRHESVLTDLPSAIGDCGSMIVVHEGMMGPKIVAINSGIMAMGSFAVIITRQQLEKALQKLTLSAERVVRIDGSRLPTLKEIETHPFINTQLMLVGINKNVVCPPIKTKIKESPLFDMITEHVTQPCIIDMRNPILRGVNTYLENMKKYGSPAKELPSSYKLACKHVVGVIKRQQTTMLNRILSMDEAINGVPNMPYLTALEMTTSPGFPWVLMGINGEKRKLFEGEPGHYRPIPELLDQIMLIIDRCKNGILPDFPYISTIKDERKPIADVLNGKSRMFTIPGVAYSIVMRMYLLPTLAHIYQCRENTFITIGMNKGSMEWDSMVRRLLEVSSEFEDMDYKKFDTTAEINVRLALSDVFKLKKMTPEEWKATKTILEYDAQALVQWDKYILALPMGTCSGSVLTAPIGSLINQVYLITAWIELAPIGLRDPAYFDKLVRNKNYGDDLAMTTHPSVAHWFNAPAIAAFLKPYNIILTPGDKSDTFKKCSVTEFVYLKNKTRYMNGKYVPLQLDPEEPINWIRQDSASEPADKCCEDNCNSALRALFFYGPARFNDIRDKILEYKNYNLISYEALYDEWNCVGKLADYEGTFTFGQSTFSLKETDIRIPRYPEEYVKSNKETMTATQLHNEEKKVYGEKLPIEVAQRVETLMADYGCLSISNSWQHPIIYAVDGFYITNGRRAARMVKEIKAGKKQTYFGDQEWPCVWSVPLRDIFINAPPVLEYNCKCQVNLEHHKQQAISYYNIKHGGLVVESQTPYLVGKDEYRKLLDLTRLELSLPKIYNVLEMHSGEGPTGTLDEPAAVTDARQGVAMTEQKSPAVVSRIENRTQSKKIKADMYNPDQPFDMAMMLNRWNYVDTVTWSTTDAVGDKIYVADVLQDMLTTKIASTPFERFNLSRFKSMLVRFETIGYRFARGRALAYFAPTQKKKTDIAASTAYSIEQAILLGAISLDPASATIAQLNIDFTYFKQYIDLVNDDVLGQVVIIVQNAFVPGTAGSNECGIKIFFSLEEAEFKQPRPGAITSFRALELHSMNALIDQGAGELKKLVNDVIPDNLVSDLLGGCLDAPQVGEQIMPIVMKEIQFTNNSRNLQYTDVLTLDPSAQQLVDSETFSTNVNEMQIKELFKKANFITTIPWNRVDAVGTLLHSENVGPMFEMTNPFGASRAITLMSYISAMFRFWRGSMIFILEIVSTQLHEGKIDFCFHPQLSKVTSSALTYPARLSQYMNTLHLRNGGNIFAIRVPYPGDSPVKIVHTGETLLDSVGFGYRFQDFFSGSVTLSVSSLLNAPESVQPDVEINMYAMPGEDYELFMNTIHNSSLQPLKGMPATTNEEQFTVLEMHAEEIDRNTPFHEMPTINLGIGSCITSDVAQSHFGEYFHSLRDMCKRFTRAHINVFEAPLSTLTPGQDNGTEPILFVVPANFCNGYSELGVSPIERIARMYRNFRGAAVHKIKIVATISNESSSTFYQAPFTATITPVRADTVASSTYTNILNFQPAAIATERQVAEFKVPFLHSRTSSLVRQEFDPAEIEYQTFDIDTTQLSVAIFINTPTTSTITGTLRISLEHWKAFADEATFGVFYHVPRITITPQAPDHWLLNPARREAISKAVNQQQNSKTRQLKKSLP